MMENQVLKLLKLTNAKLPEILAVERNIKEFQFYEKSAKDMIININKLDHKLKREVRSPSTILNVSR